MKKANICAACIFLFLLIATSEAVMASFDDILYTSEGQLCSTSIKSETKSRCIESDIEYESPVWSPDGKAIVTGSQGLDGSQMLLLLRSDGTLVGPVSNSSGYSHPVWSSDGNHIYAVSQTVGATIGRWDASGENFLSIQVRGIPNQGSSGPFEYIEMISLSPAGKTIAVLAEGFNKLLIAEFRNDSFYLTSKAPADFASVGMSAWLDEFHLLFIGRRDDRRADLWELNIKDGSVQIREIAGLSIRDSFALSPDKKSVVISGIAEGNKADIRWNLWKYTFSSSSLIKLTNGEEDLNPSWKR